MKLALLISGLLLVGSGFFAGRIKYIEIEEGFRLNYEQGNFCESLENLATLSRFKNDFKKYLAGFYSRGLCVRFNLDRAIAIYNEEFDGDKMRIGNALYHDALEEISLAKDLSDSQTENVKSILEKSNEFGFKPSNKQLEELEKFSKVFDK